VLQEGRSCEPARASGGLSCLDASALDPVARLPRTFDQLRRVPADRRARMQQLLLERTAREEWPLVPELRRRLAEAGVDADRAAPGERLAGLAACELGSLADRPAHRLRPTPDPARIRRHWSAGRKLGLVLARGQGGSLLQRGYLPVATATLDLPGLAPRIESTAHDLELLREQLLRSALLLGLEGDGLAAAPGAKLPAPLTEALEAAPARRGTRRGPELLIACPPSLDRALAAGTPAARLLCVSDLPQGTHPTAVWLEAARLLVPTPPGSRRGWLFDDLAQLRRSGESGDLLEVTQLGHHGTLLARVSLPGSGSWDLLPPDAAGLPGLGWSS
jgi:hypothetical protein